MSLCVHVCISYCMPVWISIAFLFNIFCHRQTHTEKHCAVFMLTFKAKQKHTTKTLMFLASDVPQWILSNWPFKWANDVFFRNHLFVISGLRNKASLISNIWLCNNGPCDSRLLMSGHFVPLTAVALGFINSYRSERWAESESVRWWRPPSPETQHNSLWMLDHCFFYILCFVKQICVCESVFWNLCEEPCASVCVSPSVCLCLRNMTTVTTTSLWLGCVITSV